MTHLESSDDDDPKHRKEDEPAYPHSVNFLHVEGSPIALEIDTNNLNYEIMISPNKTINTFSPLKNEKPPKYPHPPKIQLNFNSLVGSPRAKVAWENSKILSPHIPFNHWKT